MKTIVKGKNIEVNYYRQGYSFHEYFVPYHRSSAIIRNLKWLLSKNTHTYIDSNRRITSHETYFECDEIKYRLNVGEKFNGDVIESIEGTDTGDIVYYTDKVLNVVDNVEDKNKLKQELAEERQELERQLEIEKLKEMEYQNNLQVKSKKWYQFWIW